MHTLLEAYQEYLQKEKKFSVHTLTAYVNDVRFFEAFLQAQRFDVELEKVNYSHVRSWIVELVESGLSTLSVNRKISSLKSFYRFLLKTRQIDVNPLQKHKALKVARKVQIPFSEKELNLVFEEIGEDDGFEAIRDRLIVELFYALGLRRSELIGLKWVDYNTYSKTLKVLGKRNKERLLPVLECTDRLINRYLKEREKLISIADNDLLILSQKGYKVSESFVYRLINDYFSSVSEKVKKSPHVLRHTFATHLLNNGADINSVKELLGHASLSSTQIYTHSSLAELKKIYQEAHPRNRNNFEN
ncbi:tyrosine-type recombinase/integrase [Flavobacterium cerinum]|uniref:Tyrosine recombinase XerC n=1 Tax=Flavobacterium cerinum TaxID=2502784 RepID=A0ABY5IU07_9FLAO|nr:tyrosine-type recombinase/integrase [Flavobacterium cerinum]UUC45652.1 tyrosine-type recombinase/integrase [Flavobacterium cerinum]